MHCLELYTYCRIACNIKFIIKFYRYCSSILNLNNDYSVVHRHLTYGVGFKRFITFKLGSEWIINNFKY